MTMTAAGTGTGQRQIRHRVRKGRIRPFIVPARLASDPDEPAYDSEADPIPSCPSCLGQAMIRCRLPKGRIRPIIDATRTASVPDETVNKSGPNPIQSQPTPHGQVRARCRFPVGRIRPIIDAARAASVPDEPANALEADSIQSQPTRDGDVRNRNRTRKGCDTAHHQCGQDRIRSGRVRIRIGMDFAKSDTDQKQPLRFWVDSHSGLGFEATPWMLACQLSAATHAAAKMQS